MKTIDIVLPAYNEEEGIALFPNTTIIHLSRRFGHQMSLVAGIDYSRGNAFIMMNCDQQHPPSLIPHLPRKFEEGFDVVTTVREYDRQTHVLKTWTSRPSTASKMPSLLLGFKGAEPTSPAKWPKCFRDPSANFVPMGRLSQRNGRIRQPSTHCRPNKIQRCARLDFGRYRDHLLLEGPLRFRDAVGLRHIISEPVLWRLAPCGIFLCRRIPKRIYVADSGGVVHGGIATERC